MTNFLDQLLGSKESWFNWNGKNWYNAGDPGFIRLHPDAVERTLLIFPAAIEVLNTLISNHKRLVQGCTRFAKTFKYTYCHRKPGENPSEAKKRIFSNFAKTGSVAVIAAAASVGVVVLIKKGYLTDKDQWIENLSLVNTIKTFAQQHLMSAPVIFTGYSLIGASHIGLAAYQYKHSKIRFVKHVSSALIAFAAITVMAVGRSETRWHHLSYGELMLMPSLNALNFLGGEFVLDSMLYWIKPDKDNFDFSNIFTMFFTAFFVQVLVLTAFQKGSERFFDFNAEQEPVIEEMSLLAADME